MKNAQLLFSGGITVLGILLFIYSYFMPVPFIEDPMGTGGMLKVVAFLMVSSGVLITISEYRAQRANQTEDNNERNNMTLGIGVLWWIFWLVYVILIPIVGYLVMTPIVIVVGLLFMGIKKLKTIVFQSILITLVLYLVFGLLLDIRLPMGFWEYFFY